MTKNETYKLLFSIFDTVTEIYEPPFVDINKGSALRRIQDLMKSNPTSPYAKFPDNFVLKCVGTWSDTSGYIYQDDVENIADLIDIQVKE